MAVFDTLPATTRWGTFLPSASSTTATNGIFAGLGSNTAVGSGVYNGVVTSSAGTRGRYQTGTTINSICGGKIVSLITERDLNPWTQFKSQVSSIATLRFYLGLMSTITAPVSAADYLANLSGVGFWFDSSVHASNIAIMQNDGSASSDKTTIAALGTLDANAHTYAIRADNANTKFEYSFDGGTWTTINTKIPAASTTLTWQWFWECLAGSASRNCDIWYVQAKQDP